jgi:predicted RNA-binding Zn ribbon-like protein
MPAKMNRTERSARQHHPSRYMWRLDYGDRGADFVNTRTKRLKPVQIESLASAEDLLDWLSEKRLLEELVLRQLSRALQCSPALGRRLLEPALGLREALARILLARAAGRPLPREDVLEVNAFLARYPGIVEVVPGADGALSLQERSEAEPGRVLMRALAKLVVQLLEADAKGRLRRCAMDECGSIFVDRSKAGLRLWCHPDMCGSVSKVRRFRLRKRRSRPAQM